MTLMSRRAGWAILLLTTVLLLAACQQPPGATGGAGVDLSDPEVGGGAGVETGPQTPIPPATATREPSPRQDAAGAPIALPPTVTPTSAPTAEPAADDGAPPAAPAAAPSPTPPAPVETPPPPTETPAPPPEPAAAPEQPPPAAAPEQPPAADRIHVVQPGENLYRISLLYGLSWVAIAEYNGLSNPNQITVGQELRIPPSPTPAAEQGSEGAEAPGGEVVAAGEEAAAAPGSGGAGEPGGEAAAAEAVTALGPPAHTVAAGETVYSISRRYGISWAQLAEANGLSAPNQIVAGQVLKIPVDVPGPTPEFNHRVHAGETLARIAAQYGLSVAALAEANGLAAPYVIYVGQMLLIPGD